MSDKKIKEAMKQYIETQADSILPKTEERHDLTSLDEKVYATLGAKQDKHKTIVEWPFRKVAALAASFLFIVGLSITAMHMFNKEPPHIVQDTYYSIIISYENEQYGYYSNRLVIDKYGLDDVLNLKQTPDLFTVSLTDTDILQIDSVIDKNIIIGGKIYPYSNDVIILQSNGELYYFEKILIE